MKRVEKKKWIAGHLGGSVTNLCGTVMVALWHTFVKPHRIGEHRVNPNVSYNLVIV